MAKDTPEFKEKFGKSGGEAGKGGSMAKGAKSKKSAKPPMKSYGRKK